MNQIIDFHWHESEACFNLFDLDKKDILNVLKEEEAFEYSELLSLRTGQEFSFIYAIHSLLRYVHLSHQISAWSVFFFSFSCCLSSHSFLCVCLQSSSLLFLFSFLYVYLQSSFFPFSSLFPFFMFISNTLSSFFSFIILSYKRLSFFLFPFVVSSCNQLSFFPCFFSFLMFICNWLSFFFLVFSFFSSRLLAFSVVAFTFTFYLSCPAEAFPIWPFIIFTWNKNILNFWYARSQQQSC